MRGRPRKQETVQQLKQYIYDNDAQTLELVVNELGIKKSSLIRYLMKVARKKQIREFLDFLRMEAD